MQGAADLSFPVSVIPSLISYSIFATLILFIRWTGSSCRPAMYVFHSFSTCVRGLRLMHRPSRMRIHSLWMTFPLQSNLLVISSSHSLHLSPLACVLCCFYRWLPPMFSSVKYSRFSTKNACPIQWMYNQNSLPLAADLPLRALGTLTTGCQFFHENLVHKSLEIPTRVVTYFPGKSLPE
jgi:hypothetical protein